MEGTARFAFTPPPAPYLPILLSLGGNHAANQKAWASCCPISSIFRYLVFNRLSLWYPISHCRVHIPGIPARGNWQRCALTRPVPMVGIYSNPHGHAPAATCVPTLPGTTVVPRDGFGKRANTATPQAEESPVALRPSWNAALVSTELFLPAGCAGIAAF